MDPVSCFFLLRKLRFLVLFYAAVCWGGRIRNKDARRLNKLVRKAGSVTGA